MIRVKIRYLEKWLKRRVITSRSFFLSFFLSFLFPLLPFVHSFIYLSLCFWSLFPWFKHIRNFESKIKCREREEGEGNEERKKEEEENKFSFLRAIQFKCMIIFLSIRLLGSPERSKREQSFHIEKEGREKRKWEERKKERNWKEEKKKPWKTWEVIIKTRSHEM